MFRIQESVRRRSLVCLGVALVCPVNGESFFPTSKKKKKFLILFSFSFCWRCFWGNIVFLGSVFIFHVIVWMLHKKEIRMLNLQKQSSPSHLF